jgi:undecaprenyl pyrophosphate phosphatase UppP
MNLKLRIKEIWKYNISYGFNVYLGSITAVGFAALTGVLISYFGADNTGVGYFSLALTIVTPLSFIPNVIATTHYKDFSIQKNVHKRLINITLILSLLALVFIWIIVKPFINIFYGPEFQPVISLTIVLSIGMIGYGFGDFFNRFLGAHGQGKALRNSSFLVGFMLLITAAILLLGVFLKGSNREIGYLDAFIIGIAQAFAVIPGISRSGATISTGLLLGNNKNELAKFSFLMVLIPVLGANFIELIGGDFGNDNSVGTLPLLAGFVSAFITGYIACRWMIAILRKSNLLWFGVYCLIAGLLSIFVFTWI